MLPAPAEPAPALPGRRHVGVLGVTPFVTSAADFYRIDTALVVPQLDAGDWRLRIHGLVDREVDARLPDLLRDPLVERRSRSPVSRTGRRRPRRQRHLARLPGRRPARRAGVRPDADMVLSRSADGFTASTPSPRSPTAATLCSPSA